jgi:hypothetical protein
MINLKRDSNPLSVKFNMENNELSKYFNGEVYISSFYLKEKLFNFGIKKRRCENCEITEWQGNKAPLELHHINGNSKDNSLENLQILCPNCHAQTKNYRALNQKRIIVKKSIEEIKEAIITSENPRQALIKLGYIAQGGNYRRILNIKDKYNLDFLSIKKEIKVTEGTITREEAWQRSRKINRPTKMELLELIWKNSINSIAKEMGISDNAIRKWAKTYEIPVPPVGYWAKFHNNKFAECQVIKNSLFLSFNLE